MSVESWTLIHSIYVILHPYYAHFVTTLAHVTVTPKTTDEDPNIGFKERQIEMAKTQVAGNQYKLVFTQFNIGYSGPIESDC